jgi:hypothetical protein
MGYFYEIRRMTYDRTPRLEPRWSMDNLNAMSLLIAVHRLGKSLVSIQLRIGHCQIKFKITPSIECFLIKGNTCLPRIDYFIDKLITRSIKCLSIQFCCSKPLYITAPGECVWEIVAIPCFLWGKKSLIGYAKKMWRGRGALLLFFVVIMRCNVYCLLDTPHIVHTLRTPLHTFA